MHRRERERGPRLWVLALGFFFGLVFGQVLASGMPVSAAEELRRYLSARLVRRTVRHPDGSRIFNTVSLYLRYSCLALLLGFTPAGGVLLCGTAAVFGFSLSYSVGCFAEAFGRGGVALAAAAMGMRCLVTVPSFFLLAVSGRSVRRRTRVRISGPGTLPTVAVCGAALVLGICVDLILTPYLLSWIAERILI